MEGRSGCRRLQVRAQQFWPEQSVGCSPRGIPSAAGCCRNRTFEGSGVGLQRGVWGIETLTPCPGRSLGEVWWRVDSPPSQVRGPGGGLRTHLSLGWSFQDAALLLESSRAFPWPLAFPPHRMRLRAPARSKPQGVRFLDLFALSRKASYAGFGSHKVKTSQ